MPVPDTSLTTPLPLRLYSFFLRVIYLVAYVLFAWHPSLSRQLRGRWNFNSLSLIDTTGKLQNKKPDVVFFCSSAGELEQAIPIMERLASHGLEALVCSFSWSGIRFIQAKNYSYPYLLAPLDTIGNWQKFFALYQPRVTVVVRHEFWPAFCYVAARDSQLIAINMTKPNRILGYRDYMKGRLLRHARLVSAVDIASSQYIQQLLAQHTRSNSSLEIAARVEVIPDTKFDRLLDNQEKKHTTSQSADRRTLKTCLQQRPVFIVGSSWQQDAKIALQGFAEFLSIKRGGAGNLGEMLLMLVPHEPSQEFTDHCHAMCRQHSLSILTMSEWQNSPQPIRVQVFIVDRIGLLSDLYSLSIGAMVGGAMHHKIHNVIEPFAQGIPICFGPRHHSAPEAVELLSLNLAKEIRSAQDFKNMLISLSNDDDTLKARRKAHLFSKRGGADRIVKHIEQGLLCKKATIS
jgi:3-deoxy-D-manno-octulosonic-acid transferase